VKGRRITWEEAENLSNVQPGDYWIDPRHGWYAACPTPRDEEGMISCLAYLKSHKVTEHEDGTITVSPSILCSAEGSIASSDWKKRHYYHGFLEHGEWRSA